jgi:hypothetical protein
MFNPLHSLWESADILNFWYRIIELIVGSVYIATVLCRARNVCHHLNQRKLIFAGQSENRQIIYRNLLYRFRFLLLFTVFCAISTLVAILISSVSLRIFLFDLLLVS